MSKVITKYDLVGDTLVLILAGGRGSRLHELTDKRAKPALYFGGNRRIIDFALSNCINSGLNRIGVITQYAAHSLLRHLQTGWSFLPQERGEFVDMLPARQQIDDNTWYRGTADSVYQNMAIIKNHYKPKYILILAGDHIYKMDYSQMILDHVNSGAKCTVGCIEVPRESAKEFGVMAVNENLKVKAFVEKPSDPPAMIGKPNSSLASMGIYVFNAEYLYETLERTVNSPQTSHDFGKDIMPMALEDEVLYAHPFDRSCMGRNTEGEIYWRDVGTLDSYWQSNIDLVSKEPQLDIYDQTWPIRGNPVQAYPSKFFYDDPACKQVDNSLIAGGCVITNASISYSVLFDNIHVNEGTLIDESVILPQVKVGKNCILKRCIVDRHVQIPDGMQIGVDPEEDSKHFRISSKGIVLVTEKMLQKMKGETVKSEDDLD
ncbi:glucose-1-phosphate adenylyltransferase [Actinobacillus succinogenes]|uniref:Glucose-1-phosphate adenylyltransferase n=1 Tax=Actinobacillus succinogenes (strain ATCC 55618 / DSM 22257 / CCUG 43843 / 130Z) TaxID=339671 RepID=GLGC_ACTSZ|nr:glucose-1-phosphate adenylyltransferase [Actinobacillus succinogenes]A6VP17.1 RecName: Full=Glucose-1-phosphate adenylyltransferase; AltName: Full=ADP-glucose pyrophosphorylase; Short=ADPGlc PPase; AltName: Full=ADP-glucose synthase [Actinobacillus succinogenes 130Z]ABR74714.1 glucose-1-phosphate adenylyltransferase [Actinobacillus succinogenes 130Z]PHI40866.1 glucose-1-phosphate adenylyltransferase [Actinobacillus succinogenes]